MIDDFHVADGCAHDLARMLIEEGVDPEAVADALLVTAAALLAARTGGTMRSLALLSAWQELR